VDAFPSRVKEVIEALADSSGDRADPSSDRDQWRRLRMPRVRNDVNGER
jgi:hypothetical protein